MKRFRFLLSLLALAAMFACNAEESMVNRSPITGPTGDDLTISGSSSVLTNSDAEKVAKMFMTKTYTKSARTLTTKVGGMSAIRDSSDNVLAYVVNFEGGGFCIVSATKSVAPILAYSDQGEFDLSRAAMSGVSVWLAETTDAIVHQGELTHDQRAELNQMWAQYEDDARIRAATKLYDDPAMTAAFNAQMSKYRAGSGYSAYPLTAAMSMIPENVYSILSGRAQAAGSPPEYTVVILRTYLGISLWGR